VSRADRHPTASIKESAMRQHVPACPSAVAPDRDAARVVPARPERGWSLLHNGVIAFDDDGPMVPDDRTTAARA
jgi:hypothetical protein